MVDLDLRMVRYFVTVARLGSITSAAAALGISQPALSQQVRRLEQLLGVTLLDRSRRGLLLTPAGEALSREGEHLLAAAERAVRWTLEVAVAGHAEAVRLAFVPGTPTELVTIALRTADRLGDTAQLHLHRIEWGDQRTCVTSGAADIAFVQLPLRVPGMEVVPLTTEPRVGVFPIEHHLAGRAELLMADLTHEPIVDAVYERNYWIADPRPDGSHPVVVGPAASTVEEMLALVVAGRGMAITTRSLGLTYPRADLSFVLIADLEPVTYGLAWRDGESRPVVVGLIDAIRTEGAGRRVSPGS
jgi:molybdate transport repressor ModE-like protein